MTGHTKQIVSFSLYGSSRIYTVGAVENAELVHTIYPGWTTRFYIDETVPNDVISALRERGAQIVLVDAPLLGPMYGRYWRMWVAADPDVERFIIRDADSRVNTREKAAVAAWIKSEKSFHVMRDSFHHCKRMLAGMWGGIGGKLPEIRQMTDSWGHYSAWGECDQFVSEIVFPKIKHDYICHDSSGYFDDAVSFPPHEPLQGTSYVGQIVMLNMRRMDVWRRLGEFEDKILRLNTALAETKTLAAKRAQEIAEAQAELDRVRGEIANLEIPDGPRSLKFVLPAARLIRALHLQLRRIRSSKVK